MKLVYGKGSNDMNDMGKTKCYKTWSHMLERCYSSKFQNINPTYIGCSVCEDWKTLSKFKKWFDQNYVEGFQLDKDIIDKSNKQYSPSNCMFVPASINMWFRSKETDLNYGSVDCTKTKSGFAFALKVGKFHNNFFDDNGFVDQTQFIEDYLDDRDSAIRDLMYINPTMLMTTADSINTRLIQDRIDFENLKKVNYFTSDEYKEAVKNTINNWIDEKELRNEWNDTVSGVNLKRNRSTSKQTKFDKIQNFLN